MKQILIIFAGLCCAACDVPHTLALGAVCASTVECGAGQLCTHGVCSGADAGITAQVETFTVGGTVSGLAGAGLVLTNAGEMLGISMDGAFTFDRVIESGTSYEVTVSAQPSGQRCRVTNGNGTATAPVTSPQVTCLALFSVAGHAYGLTEAITLSNGGDVIQLSSEGDFSFPPAELGSAYAVTTTQPASKHCSVLGGIGTLMANVSNIRIICLSAVAPSYPKASQWSSYVNAVSPDLLCAGTEAGTYYTGCLHGGEKRTLEVRGIHCAEATLADSGQAFSWTCTDTDVGLIASSDELRRGKHLSDLINFTSVPSFRSLSVGIGVGTEVVNSVESVWWSNPLVRLTSLASPVTAAPGTVHVIDANITVPTGYVGISQDNTSIVAKPGAVVLLSGNLQSAVAAANRKFLWLEMTVDGQANLASEHGQAC